MKKNGLSDRRTINKDLVYSTYLSILNLLRLQRVIFWGRIQANLNQITAALIPKLGQENPH